METKLIEETSEERLERILREARASLSSTENYLNSVQKTKNAN